MEPDATQGRPRQSGPPGLNPNNPDSHLFKTSAILTHISFPPPPNVLAFNIRKPKQGGLYGH